MSVFAEVVVSGLAVGGIYGLIGIGFSLSYRSTRVTNVALGDFAALGAYLGWWIYTIQKASLVLALLAASLGVAVVMAVVERVALRPLYGRGPIYPILSTVGISAVFVAVFQLVWGSDTNTMKAIFPAKEIKLAGITVEQEAVWILAIGVAVAVGLVLFLRMTKIGVAMRATAQDARASTLLGVPVGRMYTGAYLLTGAIVGVAGMLVAPVVFVSPNMGLSLTLSGFVAAMIGGYGSVGGAMIGGLLLGVINAVSGYFVDPKLLGLTSYVVLVLVLVVRPTGLLGEEGQTGTPLEGRV